MRSSEFDRHPAATALDRLRYRPARSAAVAGNRHDRINREIPIDMILLGSSRRMAAGFQWLPGIRIWLTW
ncbi:MAG: hypothetical protein ACKVHE_24735 [Planctomycetales bacterium]|jgi:hypothetical protein